MCRPNINDIDNGHVGLKHVVISGAGPAGLLLAALLLQRNDELPRPLYRVTLVDNRQDLGNLSDDELRRKFRSWMLGLAGHGIDALKQVDHGKLYEEYCQHVGIQLDSLSIHLGAREIVNSTQTDGDQGFLDNFIVDRNFIVAAMSRYLNETYMAPSGSVALPHFKMLYEHKLLYVDYDHQRVLVRDLTNPLREFYVDYDLLVGCDGARSVVREAMVKRHSTFEMDVGDIFQCFKAVHVQRPKQVLPSSMHLLPDCFSHMQGIALPETGDLLNMSIGAPRHLFDAPDGIPPQLKSNDPTVVAQYVKEHFKPFELIDYDDFAQQWVNQQWNRTAQVHCNFYHSNEINVVLMGDAAHATSPSIGMGMNQALRDAQTFYLLLREYKDDLDQVLPVFSEKRVKEGNALTDLSMHLYCMDTKHQLLETLHMIMRSKLHKWLPSMVYNHPQALIGRLDYNLSDVYDLAMRLGIIKKHSAINGQIRQTYFEQTCGMAALDSRSSCWSSGAKAMVIVSGTAALVAVAFQQYQY